MASFAGALRLPSAKFPEIGTTVSGVVVEMFDAEIPKFNSKGRIDGVQTNEEGDPLMQVDLILATAQGSRILVHTGTGIFYAIGRALAEVGAEDLEPGDSVTIEYTGDGEPTSKGRNAPKQYTAAIVKG